MDEPVLFLLYYKSMECGGYFILIYEPINFSVLVIDGIAGVATVGKSKAFTVAIKGTRTLFYLLYHLYSN